MTRRNRTLLGVTVATLLAISCSVPLRVQLFNNSGQLIIVDVHDETTKIEPGENREFRLAMHGGPYALLTSEKRLEYQLNVRELPYDRYRTAWGGVVRIQLEPDFRVFILERNQNPPLATADLAQPEGFPLVPSQGPWAAAQQGAAADEPQRVPIDLW